MSCLHAALGIVLLYSGVAIISAFGAITVIYIIEKWFI